MPAPAIKKFKDKKEATVQTFDFTRQVRNP